MKAVIRPTVVLRADGGPGIGGGHIARTKIIASVLKAGGYQIVLMCKDNDWTRSVLTGVDYKVQYLRPTDNESLILSQTCRRIRAGLVILDVQDTSPEFIRYLKETQAAVITIDDAGRGAEAADATFRAGVKNGAIGPHDYFGPPYAILSPDILELRNRSAPAAAGEIQTVVCFFGTFDPRAHWKHLRPLTERFPKMSFKWFTQTAQTPRGNLEILQLSHDAFLESLLKSDLALISGGVTLFETMALGRPAVVLPQAPHETAQAELFSTDGAAILVPSPTVELLASLMDALNRTPERLRRMREKSMALVDGRGLERFMEVARRLLDRSAA